MIAHLQDAQHFLRMTVRALDCAAHKAPNHRYEEAIRRLTQRVGVSLRDLREAEDIARKAAP